MSELKAAAVVRTVVDAYDFGRFARIADDSGVMRP